MTPLQADDTSCPFSHDWAELAGVLDTGNKGTGKETINILSNILLEKKLTRPLEDIFWPWRQLNDLVQLITVQTARGPCWKIF